MTAFAAGLVSLCACSASRQTAVQGGTASFPSVSQDGKIAIVAHRGFWNSENGGWSENSIASLKAAQDAGLWGSECDIHLTADGKVIVNHDDKIAGKAIATHNLDDFAGDLLPNGERRPTLDEYLVQARKSRTTKLIVEFKPQDTPDREDLLVDLAVSAIKAHGLYDPSRVLFISFSRHICERLAAGHPSFVNQYLSAGALKNENPELYADKGINGVDYHFMLFMLHPDYVTKAHARGMSVNVWTVDKKKDIENMIDAGVDAITTNEPLLVRELLADKEYKNK